MNLYKTLDKYPAFSIMFPTLMSNIKEDKIVAYDEEGLECALSEEESAHIAKLEQGYQQSGMPARVFAVIRSTMEMDDEELVEMTSYLITTGEEHEIAQYALGIYYAFADVHNKTWNIQEMGSILIVEDGRRIYRAG